MFDKGDAQLEQDLDESRPRLRESPSALGAEKALVMERAL